MRYRIYLSIITILLAFVLLITGIPIKANAISVTGTVGDGETIVITVPTTVAAPTISLVSQTTTAIKLTWNSVGSGITYKVYRRKLGNASYTLMKSTTDTTYYNTNFTVGNTYEYYVVAVNSSGVKSKKSNVVTATRLVRPKTITATKQSVGEILYKWDKVENVDGYEITVQLVSSGFGTTKPRTYKVNSSTTSLKVSNLLQYMKYKMSIRTYKTVNGTTSYSQWKSLTSRIYNTDTVKLISVNNYYNYVLPANKVSDTKKKQYYQLAYDLIVSAGIKTGMNKETAVIKIAETIKNTFTYMNNGGTCYDWGSALAGDHCAVCQAYAELFQVMCNFCGIPCNFIKGTTSGSAEGHVWNRVRLSGVWYYIDPTWYKTNGKYSLSKTLWSDHTMSSTSFVYNAQLPDLENTIIGST